MDFKDLKQRWNELGSVDPLWAILSNPSKKNNGWDTKEFFATGDSEIDWVMNYVTSSLPMTISRSRALDFGCGVGRVTQPLCKYFEQCTC